MKNINGPPTASNASLTTPAGVPLYFTLSATDPDGDTLTYTVVGGPLHGTLSGTAPNLAYQPTPNYSGPDYFDFKVNDGTLDSNIAEVSILVTPTSGPPLHTVSGYAWGENIGWIDFGPIFGPGVYVSSADVLGSAWSENVGWINLSPETGGVFNDGSGNLSGYAWGENIGWINFRPAAGRGVSIDACGDFNGDAWGENVGWIRFKSSGPTLSKVTTSWTSPVDTTAPVTTLGAPLLDWYNASPTFPISSTDCGFGTANVWYLIDGVPVGTVGSSASATVLGDGIHTLGFYSVDTSGNKESETEVTVRVDTTPPQIVLTTPAEGDAFFINRTVPANFSVTDAVSGVAVDSITSTVPLGSPVDTSAAGTHNFTVSASDVAGNSSWLTHLYTVAYPGNIESGKHSAWGENIGWIDFRPSRGPGVTVTSTAVTGYAWGENIGWINLSPPKGGVLHDPGTGILSGYAWGESVGWINFAPDGGGVTIDRTTGLFTGNAWGESIGWIRFDPSGTGQDGLKTSWRPQPPVAAGDNYSSGDYRLSVVSPGVLSNDTSPYGNPLNAVLVAGPTQGRFTWNGDGSFEYRANANSSGTDSFTYQASDRGLPSNIVTVTLTAPAPSPPVAADDNYAQGKYVLWVPWPGVLSNDTSSYGNPLNAVLVAGPTQGQFVWYGNGSFSYAANRNTSGTDSFTYQASDSDTGALSNIVTVKVTVPVDNFIPVGVDDTYSTQAGVGLTVPAPGVLSNDTDADGDTLIAWLATPALNGSVVLNEDGSFVYNPNPGFIGADYFKYKAYDGAYFAEQFVNITVYLNHPPTATPISPAIPEDTPVPIILLGADPDGNPLTYTVVSQPSHGTLSGQPPALFYTSAPNYNGPDSFTFKVNDGTVDSNIATVSISVIPVNDPPRAYEQYATTTAGTPVNITLSGMDVDSAALLYTVVSQPSHGSLSGTPPNLTYQPVPNYTGHDSFTFKVNDGRLDSNIAAVGLTINAASSAPVAIGDVYTTNWNTVLTVPTPGVLSNDRDPQNGIMTARLTARPSHGTVVLNTDGSFVYTPTENFFGTDIFSYQVAVGTRQSEIALVTLNVVSELPANTPSGSNVSVSPEDPTGGGTAGSITFNNVLEGGTTTITSSMQGQTAPTGFTLGDPPTYYDISTTAVYAGAVKVCITYVEGHVFEGSLRLLHSADTNHDGVGDTWVDITDRGYPDTVNNVICGTTDSLSPFTVVEPTITAPVAPMAVTEPVQAGYRFRSSESGSWSATWNWGDGSNSAAMISQDDSSAPYDITGEHAYVNPGVYTVKLSISPDSVLSGELEYKYIVVYDPNGSFVTGGGWIQSPPGAYPANPELVGKATFGFVSKYQKGKSVPTGETEFRFQVANLTFNSQSYDWLVVAGARSQFKGTGSINGSGDYKFMLTTIDGQISGGGGTDKFRIKIWDRLTGEVVYDNQMGASDDAAPATMIGGGSVVIHK